MTEQLSGWGRYPVVEAEVKSPRSVTQAIDFLEKATKIIGRGLGRSYGDTSLNDGEMLSCLKLNHMESFESETGVLVAESGVSLAEILEVFVPRGWFLPVTPGTKFVTLGGAVASDVHGKDHHVAQTFSQHVLWLDIWTPALGLLRCSPQENADIFHATAGGLGLTGFIVRLAIQLQHIPSAFIHQDIVKAENLATIMEIFEQSGQYPFSVAWIDCLKSGVAQGRSLFMGGHFANSEELPEKTPSLQRSLPLTVPFDFPSFALNRFSVRAFNALYYAKAPKGRSQSTVSYNTFFYPLDAIHNWNRIYGKRGFTQYQFVIPKKGAGEGLSKILQTIASSGQGSFLAVLKLFGKQNEFAGNISFPKEGYTLALDFAVNNTLFPLLDRLDAMVLDYGGRHYLTKDCRLSADTVRRSYGTALDAFKAIKTKVDPHNIFSSLQSRRLNIA